MVETISSNSFCRSVSVSACSPRRADRFLLLGADAQLAQQLLPVGHVAADAEQPRRLAVFAVDHGRHRFEPAVVPVGARREPVVHVIGLAAAQALLDRRHHFGLIFRMNVLLEARERAGRRAECRPRLPDHCTVLDLISHDHTPIRPASSAMRTESRSGNSNCPVSPALEGLVCSCGSCTALFIHVDFPFSRGGQAGFAARVFSVTRAMTDERYTMGRAMKVS